MQVKVSKNLQDREKALSFKLSSQYLWNFRWQCYCWILKCGTGCLMAVVTGRRCSGELWALFAAGTDGSAGQDSFALLLILLLQHSLLCLEIQSPVSLQWITPLGTDTDSSGALHSHSKSQDSSCSGCSAHHFLMSQIQLLKHFSAKLFHRLSEECLTFMPREIYLTLQILSEKNLAETFHLLKEFWNLVLRKRWSSFNTTVLASFVPYQTIPLGSESSRKLTNFWFPLINRLIHLD